MARLIPSFMDDRTPPGERDVFNLLAAGPDNWVALHSLDLAPWNRGLRTEIDFVVLVPETGILCIEVKSHESISFEHDRWWPQDIKRSPFKQAADASRTFHRRLSELAPELGRVPVVHCCIFPRASFDLQPNLSVQPWELIDGRRFRSFANGEGFARDLRDQMTQSLTADRSIPRLGGPLSPGRIDAIVTICVPVQRLRPHRREEICRRQQDLDRILREQQKPALQLTALNDRVVISGGAGTGKTLIAMEVARRAADRGRRVALLCFNQLVGDWMKRRMEQGAVPLPNLVVGRAIRVMAQLAGVDVPDCPPGDYWETELPRALEERITDPDFRGIAAFDYLVLDEAQDLLARPRLWELLSQFLGGGLEKGSFALFGDFDNQVLGTRRAMKEALVALDSGRPARWHLAENCRNYRIVGDTAVRLAGLGREVYSGYMRLGGGVQHYDIFFYEDEPSQLGQLAKWLREFRSEGYRPSDISILSFRSDDACAAIQLVRQGFKLKPAWVGGEFTGYSSVHAFKGMENKVVLMTDVVLDQPEFQRHLLYTGMTRATESVRVLCKKACQDTLIGWLTTGQAGT